MPEITALMRRSKEKIIPQPCTQRALTFRDGPESRARSGPWRFFPRYLDNIEIAPVMANNLAE
jgi:hypothetical protein